MGPQRTKAKCELTQKGKIKERFQMSVPFVFNSEMRKSRFMRRPFFLSLFIVSLVILAVGQPAKKPSFSAYPATVETARAKSINFKNDAAARTMRTRLKEALAGGVNFAGHYIVAGWGCGTGCISGAIIDGRTGTVLWPLPLYALAVWYDGDDYTKDPVEYRKNSRLLIIRGIPGAKDNEPQQPWGEYYYEWTGRELKQVKFIPYKKSTD